jgi:hypothetical protein
MAMGTRKQREKQEEIWIAHHDLASAPGHPFYQRLNELLEAEKFDEFVEGRSTTGTNGSWQRAFQQILQKFCKMFPKIFL